MKPGVTWTLLLGVLAGIVEYLNQNTFGFPSVWYEVMKYAVLVISTFGITAATGHQLGIEIENLLHMKAATINLIGVLVIILGGAVSTFSLGDVVKGLILAVVAFLTSTFGPFPGLGAPVAPAVAK